MGRGRSHSKNRFQSQVIKCSTCPQKENIRTDGHTTVARKLHQRGWLVHGILRICPNCLGALKE